MTETPDETTATRPTSHIVPLDEPIVRGKMQITSLTVSRPKALQLKDLSLRDLLGTQVSAYLELFPRITMPPITDAEAEDLSASDLAELISVTRDFFMTKAEQAIFQMLIEDRLPKA